MIGKPPEGQVFRHCQEFGGRCLCREGCGGLSCDASGIESLSHYSLKAMVAIN